MEPMVQVAIIGIVTTLITTAGIVVAAIVNSLKERGDTADSAIEMTLRERIVLRDEQIADLREDLAEKDAIILRLLKRIDDVDDEKRRMNVSE